MNESIVMKELREIRDAQSARHNTMTMEEIIKESREAGVWFENEMKKRREAKAKANVVVSE
jgi:hypothetical protein